MTRRTVRRLAWVGVGLTVVALVLGVTVRLLEPPPGFTEANVQRIHAGMRMEEVVTILGREPDGWVMTGKCRLAAVWHGEKGIASAYPDTDGRVHSASFWEPPETDVLIRAWLRDNFSPQRPNPLARLRALLGW